MGVILAYLKTEMNYQEVENEEDKLHEQEEGIFDDDKDDTITGFKTVKIVCYDF